MRRLPPILWAVVSGGLLSLILLFRPVGVQDMPAAVGNVDLAQGAASRKTSPASPTVPPAAPSFLSAANPFAPAADALRSRRPWDAGFLDRLDHAVVGDPVTFEVADGIRVEGTVGHLLREDGVVSFVSGSLTSPEAGQFFFQRRPGAVSEGNVVGLVEFPGSQRAYRVEPSVVDGGLELVARSLHEVRCVALPKPTAAQTADAQAAPPLNPNLFPTVPSPPYQNGIPVFQSLPGATAVVYLDFQGGHTTSWGGITYERPNVSAFMIREIWKRVAERFMPFQLNVTTDLAAFTNAYRYTRIRCVFTPTSPASPGNAGVAYVGSFTWGGLYPHDTVCWSFVFGDNNAAETAAHEIGHTLGLNHWGRNTGPFTREEYFTGHGSGATSWAPIMGAPYGKSLPQWSRGDYPSAIAATANGTQDDLAVIANKVPYREDDAGAALATARPLEIQSNLTAFAEGVIETSEDADAFHFSTTGGTASLTANPVGFWSSLAVSVTLHDAAGAILASNQPSTSVSGSVTQALPAGAYFFQVRGAGRNDPAANGFTSYGSLGYYSATGLVEGAVLPSRFSIPENTPAGTLIGTLPPRVSSPGPHTWILKSGNTGGAFALDAEGRLTVANADVLDYEALAADTQRAVQFELFVDILDASNPTLSETNRRVVIAITDVNEAPVVEETTLEVLARTRPGTVIGGLIATDPDPYTLLSYALAGAADGLFAVDAVTGQITVTGLLDTAVTNVQTLSVAVSDQQSPPLLSTGLVHVVVLTNHSPFQPGAISYAVHTNLADGPEISALIGDLSFPGDPAEERWLPSFEGPSDVADRFGAVLRGYLIPPVSGDYHFWIASDDNGELWLSPGTNAADIVRIAHVSGSEGRTDPRQWDKFATQRSEPVLLTAGNAYFIEARMKDDLGGDHVSVAWENLGAGLPRGIIPGRFLAPFRLNFPPRALGFTNVLHRDTIAGSRVGVVGVADANVEDDHTFDIVSGNAAGLFSIEPATGVIRVADEAVLLAAVNTEHNLLVRVRDADEPVLSGTATARIHLVDPGAITATGPHQEIWTNIVGNAVSALTASPDYPKRPHRLRPVGDLEAMESFGIRYGSRLRAHLRPSVAGSHVFHVAADDTASLRFGATTNVATPTQIASLNFLTAPREWTKYASQNSAPVTLSTDGTYLLEVLHKQGVGGDHVSVGWTLPDAAGPEVIPASALRPADINHAPELADAEGVIPVTATNGTAILTLAALDSPLEAITYKIVSGNEAGAFRLDPDLGNLTVDQSEALAGLDQATLIVMAQDSGYGGLYPRKFVTAEVLVTVITVRPPPDLSWNGGSSLSLLSEAGSEYVLQETVSLMEPVQWRDLSTNAGTGETLLLPISFDAGRTQSFFRVFQR